MNNEAFIKPNPESQIPNKKNLAYTALGLEIIWGLCPLLGVAIKSPIKFISKKWTCIHKKLGF
jgi:hypothetical protein